MSSISDTIPDDVVHLAQSMAPDHWPTADVKALRDCARRCCELAERCERSGTELDAAHRRIDGAGSFHTAMMGNVQKLAGTPDSLTARSAAEIRAIATLVDEYADVVESARGEMAVIASIADRDRLVAELRAQLGDDSHRVQAASAGRLMMATAGDEYVDASGQIDHHKHDDGQPPPAATSGMMPFAALGGLAGGAAVAAVQHSAGSVDDGTDLTDADRDWLQQRAAQLQSGVPVWCGDSVRMSVGIGVADDGSRTVVVATNEYAQYMRAGVALRPDEIAAGDGRAAELACAGQVAAHNMRLAAVASALPIAASVLGAVEAAGADVIAPTSDYSDDGHWEMEPHVGEHH